MNAPVRHNNIELFDDIGATVGYPDAATREVVAFGCVRLINHD